MRATWIVCDNCGGEIRRIDGPASAADRRKMTKTLATVAGQRFDLCPSCVAGRPPVDLTATPISDWPRFVRSDDVRAYIERDGGAEALLLAEIDRLRDQLAARDAQPA